MPIPKDPVSHAHSRMWRITMSRQNRKRQSSMDFDSFSCVHCGSVITPPSSGTAYRNHCPRCLWSVHVDLCVGDRRSGCRGAMEPIAVWIRGKREWAVIHRCTRCGIIRSNRISGDDNELRLFGIAVRPLTQMPFPAELVLSQILGEN